MGDVLVDCRFSVPSELPDVEEGAEFDEGAEFEEGAECEEGAEFDEDTAVPVEAMSPDVVIAVLDGLESKASGIG